MALHKALLIAAASMAVVMGALLPVTAFPDNHVVGEGDGWELGVDYADWARINGPIPAGDTLMFIYDDALHNVMDVNEEAYNSCVPNNNAPTWDCGHDILQLGRPGKYFFISGIGDDCARGMKLAITAMYM